MALKLTILASIIASTFSLLPLNARWVAEGDSITNAATVPNYIWAVDVATNGRFYKPNGYNQATAGQTLADMVTQISNVTALTPDVVSLLAGTNSLAANHTAAAMFTDWKAMVEGYIAAGVKWVVCMPILPRNDAAWLAGSTATWETRRLDFNSQIAAYALTNPKVKLTQNLDATFNPTTDCFDGLHPNWKASIEKIGAAFAAVMNTLIVQTSINTTAINLLTNSAFTGTTGTLAGTPTPTGVVPTSWGVSTSGTGIVLVTSIDNAFVNADGATVNGAKMTVTGTPDAAARVAAYSQTVNTTSIAGVGVAVEGWVDFKLDAGSANVRSVYANMDGQGLTPNANVTQIMSADGRSGRLRFPPYVMGTVDNSINVQFGVKFDAGAITCGVTFGTPVFQVVQQPNP